jgi:hypothetical protein
MPTSITGLLALTSVSIPQIEAPEGWTTDPKELDYDDWTSDDGGSPSQILAKRFGLAASRPIMVRTPQMGSDWVIFKSGVKFYIFNLIETTVWEITTSQDLKTIINIMTEKGTRFLGVKQIKQIKQIPG